MLLQLGWTIAEGVKAARSVFPFSWSLNVGRVHWEGRDHGGKADLKLVVRKWLSVFCSSCLPNCLGGYNSHKSQVFETTPT